MKKGLFIILISLLLNSCLKMDKPEISFYHWKSKAKESAVIKETLQQADTKKLFLHYFDVDKVREATESDDGVYPVYTLTEVDELYKGLEIIPVVFITNTAIKEANIDSLSNRIRALVDEISNHHFNSTSKELQLDCDWSQTSRANYFQLIELLKKHYEVSATIRLHQVKFSKRTGIPPVKKGVLMVYNVGDLKNENQNSILESSIVSQYINEKTTYPLRLDVALPIFSQTVLMNKKELRIVNGTFQDDINTNTNCFEKLSPILSEVKKDTLFRGFYLSKGFKIKTEKISFKEIINSYKIIKSSSLDLDDILFYHLNDDDIKETSIDQLIRNL